MEEIDRPINLQDALQYFCDDNYVGCEELTEEFVNRITDVGTDSSISEKLNYALRAWADAEDGEDAGYASHFIRDILQET